MVLLHQVDRLSLRVIWMSLQDIFFLSLRNLHSNMCRIPSDIESSYVTYRYL